MTKTFAPVATEYCKANVATPGLTLFDGAGEARALLTGADGSLFLYDKDGEPRAVLDVDTDDGSPSLTLFDAKGDALWQAPR